ncbi:GntR family transcriptional regulator [Ferrovibrio sp.]|uniref:GntR family transcriptional regulator n=1 Tax=Ferrovibrio sp. TaxID=1917215 RepID=UPI000CB8DAF5|nr:GntR family transcriptional regulator [Ferrovibrio sp.]PJI40943.1 MAG: GntR family transcriptional regulator [Ferrovibrio sp.]
MDEKRTLAEQLRDMLAEQIVTGERLPGARLDEADLAETFGMSRTPVREALKALAGLGLVEYRPHRGALVALPTTRRIEEMFEVMAEVEATCARLATLRMTAPERRELSSAHEAALTLVKTGDLKGYTAFNNDFHDLIYRGSKNDFLAETAWATRRRVLPFRRSQFRVLGRLHDSHAEHDRVVQAILSGDALGAEAAMRGHVGKVTTASVGQVTGTQPEQTAAASPARLATRPAK